MEDGSATGPVTVQRIENGVIAALAMVGTIVIAPDRWWLPLALFVVFDLSALGYLRSPAAGAAWYNAVHTYVWPAAVAIAATVIGGSAPEVSRWSALIALAWAFHVATDRALGYGLKLPDAFAHTHLGWIGRDRANHP